MNNAPIGLFDSGLGGLTVVRQLHKVLANESTIYFADQKNVPYGPRSDEEVRGFSVKIAQYLVSEGAKAVVIACNTATAVGLEAAQAAVDVPVIGVVPAGATLAVKTTTSKRVGVIATEKTIKTQAYNKAIGQMDSEIHVFGQACPLFTPLIEAGMKANWDALTKAAHEYLAYFGDKDVDTMVLGCTHYPLLTEVVSAIMGPRVQLVDPAVEAVRMVITALEKRDGLADANNQPFHRFYTSGSVETFRTLGGEILGRELADVRHSALFD